MSNNIKVAIRVRPLIAREKKQKLTKQWEVNENSIYPIDTQTGKRNGDAYNFDHIFDCDCSNIDIYNTVVQPVVEKAVNGFNGSVFAYGQTSSGKTHTMMGHADEPGLISVAVQNIFQAIEQSENRKFLLRVSYMEIYNEKMYDLLDIKNTVKIYEDYNGSVNVTLKEEITDSAEKIYALMRKGDKARKIGETNMNEKSSRSHTIFRIIIESSELESDGIVSVAHLNLVDLAGSERAFLTRATGMRLKEGAHINKSLSTLSLVMKQLSESQDFINFRDSKLTRILQPSLGGNALTAIICAVTPVALEETHSTLAFASRAKTIKNKPQLNELIPDKALINRYALQIDKLRHELEKANNTKNMTAQRNMELEKKIAMLEKCIIYPSRSHGHKKNGNNLRRRTWSAPQSNLSVIFENDLLQNSDNANDSSLNIEVFDFEDQFEKLSCEIKSERYITAFYFRSINFVKMKSFDNSLHTPSSDLLPQFQNQSEDLTSWLTSFTDTPKSELRKRVEYFQQEFDSLRELTRLEKFILEEDSSEIKDLKEKLAKAEHNLDMERKNQAKLAEVQKKNDDLSKEIQQLRAAQEKTIDYEFVIEMHKEKFKKREHELLERLRETNEELSMFKTKNLTPQLKIPPEIEDIFENYKLAINSLHLELSSGKPVFILQEILSSIKQLPNNLCEISTDYENLGDFLDLFRQIFELISILFSNDSLIQDLNEEKNKLSNQLFNVDQSNDTETKCVQTEEHISDLLSKDKEIVALSDKLMEYIEEISSLENQLEKNKRNYSSEEKDAEIRQLVDKNVFYLEKISKLEEEIEVWVEKSQNLISKSIYDENFKELTQIKEEIELKNKTIIDLENNVRNKTQENEKLNTIILNISENEKNLKNIENQNNYEIDNLSSKISDYEKEINKYINELQIKTEIINEKNLEIKDLMAKVFECETRISRNEQELSKLQFEPDFISEHALKSNYEFITEQELNKFKSDFEIRNEQELKKLKSELESQNKQEMNQFKSDIEIKNEQKLNKLKSELEFKKEQELNQLKSDFEIKKEQELNMLKSNLNSENDELHQFKSDFENKNEQEFNKLKSELESIKEQEMIKLKSELESKNEQELNQLKFELEYLNEQELNRLKSKFESIKGQELNQLESDFEIKKEQELNKFKTELESIKEQELIKLKFALESKNEEELNQLKCDFKNKKEQELNQLKFEFELKNNLELNKLKSELESIKEQELIKLKSELESKNEELNQLRCDFENKQEELNQLKFNFESLKEQELNQLKSDFELKNKLEFNKLKSELESIKEQELIKLKSELEIKNEEDLNQLKCDFENEKEQKLNQLKSDYKYKNEQELNKSKFELEFIKQQELTKLKSEFESKYDQKLKQLETDFEIKNKQELYEFKSKLESIKEQEFIKLKYDFEIKYEHELNQFKSELEFKNKELSQLKFDFEVKKEQELNKFKSGLEISNEQELNQLKSDLQMKNEQELNKFKSELEYKKEQELAKLKSELESKNEQELNQFKFDLQIKNEQVLNTYKSELDSIEKQEQNKLKSELEIKTKEIQILMSNLSDYESTLNKMKDSSREKQNLNEAKNTIQILSEDLQRTKSDFQQIQILMNSKESEIQNLISEISLKNEQLSEKEEIIIELQKTVSKANIFTQTENLELNTTCMSNGFANTERKLFETEAKLERLQDNLAKIKKKYENKLIQITQTANSKLTNMKSKYESMQAEITYKDANYQEMKNKLALVQSQIDQKNSDNFILQKKIEELKTQNKNTQKLLEEYQERSYSEIHDLKKKLDAIKQENLGLKNLNTRLNKITTETQELFATTKSSMELLQKENDNYVSNVRSLEERIESLKYELHEIKNKSKENIRKVKRQSLHDSSRNLSGNENNDDNSKLIYNNENDLQKENKRLQKKNEQLIALCKLRKQKLEKLERKMQNTN